MKDILDRLKLLESEKPRAALLDKKFSSFRDMEQLQGDASITTSHKPVKMGDKQKGLTGKLVGTSEAVENTVEDLVAKLGSEFKSQYLGDKKSKKDQELSKAPKDKEIGEKKPAKDIHVKEGSLNEFAQGSGGGESGRWYTDDEMADIVGDGWWQDMDVSGANIGVIDSEVPKEYMIQQAQAWLDDQGYNVQVLNCKVNDDDMEWYIEGSFHNPRFAKKGVAEGEQRVDSLVTDALKIMQGSEVGDAVKALKTVLGDREYNGRRGHYNFYVKQLVDMSSQQGVKEGGTKDRQWSNKDMERLRVTTRDFDDIMASDGPDQTKHDLIKKRIQTKPMAGPKGVLPEQGVAEGLGDDERRAFKRQELQHELGHEKNNIQVSINGKPWKVFPGKGYADSTEEYRHLQSMKVWAAKKSAGSGKTWTVSLTGADANMNEGVEMSTAGPMGSMPTDDIPQVQHVTEDWGSSDWTPVMKGMWDVIDRHYAGRANPESIEDAAQNAAEFYYDDMGYDEVEDAKDRIIGMFLRRPDGIGRKQDKTPSQELEEAGVIPAPAPDDAGMQGQLNVKQLASVLPGIDAKTLAMAMTTMKAGSEPSLAQQKALAGAFAALVKADPQTTTKAMAILKKVSAEPVAAPVAAKPAPAPTAPVGTSAPAPAVAPAPAAESMDYIKENKRKR